VEDHPVDSGASAAHRRGHLDRVASQGGIGVIRGRAGQQPTRMQIQHRSEIELAFVGGDLGDVLCRPPNYADDYINGVLW
jgi:hypothetical protein